MFTVIFKLACCFSALTLFSSHAWAAANLRVDPPFPKKDSRKEKPMERITYGEFKSEDRAAQVRKRKPEPPMPRVTYGTFVPPSVVQKNTESKTRKPAAKKAPPAESPKSPDKKPEKKKTAMHSKINVAA